MTTPTDVLNLRNQLITAGVRNLKEFGYPEVNGDNIITDHIYSVFFRRMLEENRDANEAAMTREIADACDALIAEIDAANPTPDDEDFNGDITE